MNEESFGERPCKAGGNYGLCKTHPTCDMIQRRLFDAEEKLASLGNSQDEITNPARMAWHIARLYIARDILNSDRTSAELNKAVTEFLIRELKE